MQISWTGKINANQRLEELCANQDGFVAHSVEQYFTESDTNRHDLYLGDNLAVALSLLEEYRGKLQCIYLDPPFFVGSDFGIKLGKAGAKTLSSTVSVFSDRWTGSIDSYASFLWDRLIVLRELLSPEGFILLHCDSRTSALSRMILTELFSEENYLNEIVWFYKTGGAGRKLGFSRKHDTIHLFSRDVKNAKWVRQKEVSYVQHRYGFSNIQLEQDEKGYFTRVYCRDVMDIPALRGNQSERVAYPTQKPEALLARLLGSTSKEGDLVADFFSGSGTLSVVAEKMGRRSISVDCSPYALQMATKRLRELKAPYRQWVNFSCSGQQDLVSGVALRDGTGDGELNPSPRVRLEREGGKTVVRLVEIKSRRSVAGEIVELHDLFDSWALGYVEESRGFVPLWWSQRLKASDCPLKVSCPLSDLGRPNSELFVNFVGLGGVGYYVRLQDIIESCEERS